MELKEEVLRLEAISKLDENIEELYKIIRRLEKRKGYKLR